MRLLLALVFVALLGGFLMFLAWNLDTTVPVSLFGTQYAGVPLWLVVFGGIFVSVMLISVYSLAEGTRLRLVNRRLRRDLHKLETEVNFLRTRPASALAEPDALLERPAAAPAELADDLQDERAEAPASAPVYGAGDEVPPEDDDDFYSGGRAV
jgi:uncharacterized integral membrane protein